MPWCDESLSLPYLSQWCTLLCVLEFLPLVPEEATRTDLDLALESSISSFPRLQPWHPTSSYLLSCMKTKCHHVLLLLLLLTVPRSRGCSHPTLLINLAWKRSAADVLLLIWLRLVVPAAVAIQHSEIQHKNEVPRTPLDDIGETRRSFGCSHPTFRNPAWKRSATECSWWYWDSSFLRLQPSNIQQSIMNTKCQHQQGIYLLYSTSIMWFSSKIPLCYSLIQCFSPLFSIAQKSSLVLQMFVLLYLEENLFFALEECMLQWDYGLLFRHFRLYDCEQLALL